MDFAEQRAALVDRLAEREDLSPATDAAMRAVPRHAFVPAHRRQEAYADRPLPIGQGQTISAPHMVAVMTELLDASGGDAVLELGTGCGYHAAVTAELVGPGNVYSVEYHADLAARARETLAAVGYEAVSVRTGDGKDGWAAHAPYDATYLTCAAEEFPDPVVDQVAPDGVVLGPLGDDSQVLVRAHPGPGGSLDRERHGTVRFVPLQ